ncbi:hypothetical protein IACHDJAJ_00055 [Aeromonas phage vB_AdhS_TS3]|nr:hypothetical protein IACHDJAJ_00055 [Aeromonas phage vB_AdhS_TS3]
MSKERKKFIIMFDLEYLGKDDSDAQILDIGVAWGSSIVDISSKQYLPAWQKDGVVNPETLKFWVALNPKILAQYLNNTVPMQHIAKELMQLLLALKRSAESADMEVVVMSKGITHDLPKLEYQLEEHLLLEEYCKSGFGIFESLFGYNCRRDMRSVTMYRPEALLEEATEFATDYANKKIAGKELHDAQWDAVSQLAKVLYIAYKSE